MKFTTPCFVRVENPQERKELIEWLNRIGHIEDMDRNIPDFYPNILTNFIEGKKHIDCGRNIQLFKALAAMNDENDSEQWFITVLDVFWNGVIVVPEGTFELCHKDKRMENPFESDVIPARKATASEIIEYFKN